MSLINDALKKAQKLQTQGQSPPPAAPGNLPAGAPGASGPPNSPPAQPLVPSVAAGPASRDRPLPGQLFMLLAFGAGVLIALSVLATVYLLRPPASMIVAQAPASPALPEKPGPAPLATASLPSPLPTVPAPVQTVTQMPAPMPAAENSAVGKSPPAAPPAVASTPVTVPPVQVPDLSLPPPAPTAPNLPSESTLPVPRSPESVEPSEGKSSPNGPALSSPNGLNPTEPDPKILAYLDALQVAGIRMSGTDGKVLMNDRVFRENEVVDRLLGLRLKKIEPETLTFIDERGVTYTKNF